MSFEGIKIKLHLSIGYSGANQNETEYLSEYWTEAEWNNLTKESKDQWLNDFCIEWSNNYIEQSVWLDGGEDGNI